MVGPFPSVGSTSYGQNSQPTRRNYLQGDSHSHSTSYCGQDRTFHQTGWPTSSAHQPTYFSWFAWLRLGVSSKISLCDQLSPKPSGTGCTPTRKGTILLCHLGTDSRKQVTLKARHIPGRLNVVVDKLSRLGQTTQTKLSLVPEVFQSICSRWHWPQIDLFATSFNNKLPLFVSPVLDPLSWAVNALSLPWEDLDAYAFPSAAILGKVVKLQDHPCHRIILIAPGCPNMPWFWDLVAMSSQIPLCLPNLPNLLTQPFNQTPSRTLSNLSIHAWPLEPRLSKSRASLRQWLHKLRFLIEDQPDQSMRQSGPFLQSCVSLTRWTSGHPL